MNPFIRWAKFNIVGAMGMVLQLAALALFNRVLHGHYLYASALAIELTLLHNFLWHVHYTWRDRSDNTSRLRQLIRFHLSNGMVSILGNLILMRLFVHEAHLPVLAANVIAVLSCSLANFGLGNIWAFSIKPKDATPLKPHAASCVRVALLLMLFTSAVARGQAPEEGTTDSPPQTSASLPDAPKPQLAPRPGFDLDPSVSYVYHVGALCGTGATTSTIATKPTAGCGVGMTLIPLPIFFEFGLMAPQANRSNYSGYISVDGSIPLAPPSSKYLPMAIVGYSRLFETGHAFDYGLALAMPRPRNRKVDAKSLRIELRDYWTFANPEQHNVMLRVGWMTEKPD